MATIHPRFLVDEKNNKQAIVLSIEEWNAILEELEELDDIRAYDEAKARGDETIRFAQAVRELNDECQPDS